MSKPFKTIDEQIELLRYRGMTIADDEVARHALETLGYYRLSGYSYPFRKPALHNWGCSWGLNPPVSRRQRVM